MSQIAKKEARSKWSGKWAFILAAAASAVGLGNMWRFPYLAAKYGGGTFLLTYCVFVFTFGISMLLLENALGRKTGKSVICAFSSINKKYKFIGILAAIVPFIITPYYCIIGGWVAKYMSAYLTASTHILADGGNFFVTFITGNYATFIWMLLFMGVTFLVVFLGVKGGIEKVNLVMMPALIVAAIFLAGYVMTMPGALDGVAMYLTPDLTKLSPELCISALGQMFYSLSLAMGIMVTYGSYLDKKESLTQSVTRIGGFDLGVSFLGGLMIVPAAFVTLGSAEAVAENSGPSLMFVILPQVFDDMGMMAPVIGSVFFILVLFAALTSAISLTETCVSIVQDGLNWSRRRSLAVTFSVIAVCGIIINMGYNDWSFIQPLGEGSSILDFADFISNSVLMPVVAFLTCIFIGWIMKPQGLIDEIKISSRFRMEKAWVVMIKYIAPVLIAIIMVAFIAAQFGFFKM